jgi:hypothetical protein
MNERGKNDLMKKITLKRGKCWMNEGYKGRRRTTDKVWRLTSPCTMVWFGNPVVYSHQNGPLLRLERKGGGARTRHSKGRSRPWVRAGLVTRKSKDKIGLGGHDKLVIHGR